MGCSGWSMGFSGWSMATLDWSTGLGSGVVLTFFWGDRCVEVSSGVLGICGANVGDVGAFRGRYRGLRGLGNVVLGEVGWVRTGVGAVKAPMGGRPWGTGWGAWANSGRS